MAVISPGKLDDARPSGEGPGETKGTHGRFGSRIDESDPLKSRNGSGDGFPQKDFRFGEGAKGESPGGCVGDGGEYVGVGMAQDEGAKGEDEVDVFAAIKVGDISSGPFADDNGMASHRLVGPNGAAHASRKDSACLFVAFF